VNGPEKACTRSWVRMSYQSRQELTLSAT